METFCPSLFLSFIVVGTLAERKILQDHYLSDDSTDNSLSHDGDDDDDDHGRDHQHMIEMMSPWRWIE